MCVWLHKFYDDTTCSLRYILVPVQTVLSTFLLQYTVHMYWYVRMSYKTQNSKLLFLWDQTAVHGANMKQNWEKEYLLLNDTIISNQIPIIWSWVLSIRHEIVTFFGFFEKTFYRIGMMINLTKEDSTNWRSNLR